MTASALQLVLQAVSAVGLVAMLGLVLKGGVILGSFQALTSAVEKIQSREEARDAVIAQLALDVARTTAIVDGIEKRVELLEQHKDDRRHR